MSDEPALDDGWHPQTAAGDTVLRDYVDSSARYLVNVGRAVGAATIEDDDVAGAHHDAEFPFANMTIVRRPLTDGQWDDVVARLRAAFPPGRPFVLASPFATPDLAPAGFTRVGHPPFMVRAATPDAKVPDVAGITIERVTDTDRLAVFEPTLVEAYPGGPAGSLFSPGILDVDGVALWLAHADGVPVATAAGHHGGAVNGVEIISCLPSARGRGIGEAITWAATLARPELPAALFASDAGRPVYERMGFVPVLRFTLWVGA
ncbi:MAG: GNAT family N-acetyltransferase [Acidimicrobiia bacterium]